MSLGICAIIKIKPDTNADFEAAFGELQKAVRANEKGCTQYDLLKSNTEATTYFVFEQYADQAAVEAHRGTDYFKTLGAKMGPSMAGRPEVTVLTKIS